MNKSILSCCFALVLSTALAQKHILPPKLKEEAQAKGLMESTTEKPQVFIFKNKEARKSKNAADSTQTWLPGEFEESQAVVLSWGAYDIDAQLDTVSSLALISAKLCMGIQPETPVWIRIFKAEDSLAIKRYMDRIGAPLYNYKFIVKFGDDWWARDFGPIGYYSGPNDSLVLADFKYYSGREHDNALPATNSYRNGWGHKLTRMNFEGGNLIADGFGTVFYSSAVTENNTPAFVHYPTMTAAAVADSMRTVLQAGRVVQLPRMNCDGGTGHLDLYLKMMDEETWVAAQYPTAVTSSDRTISESNVNFLKTLKTVYNRPYRFVRVPLPTDNNGGYSQQLTCTNLNNFGRSFVNGITVNKTFIYPIWDTIGSGNTNQRRQLETMLKKALPGLKLYGIDVRAMTGFGGQLHCITMQIPTSNPVKFWHPSFRDQQTLLPKYHLVAKIKNKSGVDSAKAFWRKGTSGAWLPISLSDSSGFFTGDIDATDFQTGDTIQYYLRAHTTNGKTAFHPIVAPDGYFQFVVNQITETESLTLQENEWIVYPNPTNASITLVFDNPEKVSSFTLTTITGKLVSQGVLEHHPSENHEIDMSRLPIGLYLLSIQQNGKTIGHKKISRQ